jgi:hypothetical protein
MLQQGSWLKFILCIVSCKNTKTLPNKGMTKGNRKSENVMHNHDTSDIETKLSN